MNIAFISNNRIVKYMQAKGIHIKPYKQNENNNLNQANKLRLLFLSIIHIYADMKF